MIPVPRPAIHAPRLAVTHEPLSASVHGIALAGELGMGSVPALDRVIKGVFEQGVYRLVIDLAETTYIASSGMGILVASTEIAREHHGDIVFAGTAPRVMHVFSLMGLVKLLRFVPTVKEALQIAQA